LVGLRTGSAVLDLEPVDARLVADPVVDALQALADGLAGKQALEPPVIDLLRGAVQSLGYGASVGMRVPDRPQIEFDEGRLASLVRPTPSADPTETRGAVDGWLHAVDIDPDEVRIRDTSGRDWSCHYAEALEPRVRELIGRVVRASGTIRAGDTRPRLELTAVEPVPLPPGVEPSGRRSTEEVLRAAMARASVTQPQTLASLAADVDETADEEMAFEEALRAIR
jgi:hypothetical protein